MHFRVVSLAHATERRSHFATAWSRYQYSFLDAVDARNLVDLPFSHRYRREMLPGEVACLMSHRLLWKEALSTGSDGLVILEDDTIPAGDMASVPDLLASLPPSVGLLILSKFSRAAIAKIWLDIRTKIASLGLLWILDKR